MSVPTNCVKQFGSSFDESLSLAKYGRRCGVRRAAARISAAAARAQVSLHTDRYWQFEYLESVGSPMLRDQPTDRFVGYVIAGGVRPRVTYRPLPAAQPTARLPFFFATSFGVAVIRRQPFPPSSRSARQAGNTANRTVPRLFRRG